MSKERMKERMLVTPYGVFLLFIIIMDLLRRSDKKHIVVSDSEKFREEMRSDAVDALNGKDIPI